VLAQRNPSSSGFEVLRLPPNTSYKIRSYLILIPKHRQRLLQGAPVEILDEYVLTEPSSQNVLDTFKGEWSSCLPAHLGLATQPGVIPLFEDGRVVWAEDVLGQFTDWRILELGPLEGGHSYMFQDRKARQVIAIEANSRAFLKCLCIKDVLKLDKVEFKLGDFMPFLERETSKYDMVFASGVLYHMQDPIRLLELMSKVSDRVFIWTQYYDADVISNREDLKHKFSPLMPLDYGGVTYEYSVQSYKDALDWSGFCGGSQPVSKWLTRNSILKALNQFGFADVQINFDQPDHPNGPAFALCAQKQGATSGAVATRVEQAPQPSNPALPIQPLQKSPIAPTPIAPPKVAPVLASATAVEPPAEATGLLTDLKNFVRSKLPFLVPIVRSLKLR
jgi:hypothetical protein